MAEQLKFELVSPEKLVLSDTVDSVVVPGSEGDFSVLENHAPMMSTLRVGFLETSKGSEKQRFFVKGGLAEVGQNGLSVLAEHATLEADLKADYVDQEIATLKASIEASSDKMAIADMSYALNQLTEVRAKL